MKKVLFFMLLLVIFSCKTTQKEVSKIEKKNETEKETVSVEKESSRKEETVKEEDTSNSQKTENESTITLVPINPDKPSFYTDPVTGKQNTFQNTSIVYNKKSKKKSQSNLIKKDSLIKSKTIKSSVAIHKQKTKEESKNLDKKIKRTSYFSMYYFITFMVIILLTVLVYKRKEIISFFVKKAIV